MTNYALTHEGEVVIERPATPLGQLLPGDYVLGAVNPEQPDAPRTVHLVTASLDWYHVPTEEPTKLENFLIGVGLNRLVAGDKVEGVLVDNGGTAALFALGATPALDVVHPDSLRSAA